MDKLIKQARKESGLANFERTATQTTSELGRKRRAYRVPGTSEAGQYAMIYRHFCDILKKLQAAKGEA